MGLQLKPVLNTMYVLLTSPLFGGICTIIATKAKTVISLVFIGILVQSGLTQICCRPSTAGTDRPLTFGVTYCVCP